MEYKKLIKKINWETEKLDLNISVDCVLFTVQDLRLKVLLTQPFPEFGFTLPGGFIRTDEETDRAATRILHERTGVEQIYLEQFKVFSDPERFSFEALVKRLALEPKLRKQMPEFPNRVISIGYFALVNFESLILTGGNLEEETCWSDILQLPDLNFDHASIIEEALNALRKELHFKPVLYNLLPEKFTMPELQNLYEIILGKTLDRGSFQRKMLRWDIFERLDEQRKGVAHKRPWLYKYNKEKYDLVMNQRIRFTL